MSIDRIELCGAVLSKRLKVFLDKESRYKFAKYYHIVDSQIVFGMIQKDSYGFNTFAATRIGEIQEGTKRENWYWTESKNNIADWITRGRKPQEIGQESIWQAGPKFLIQPENKWPIKQLTYKKELPERIKMVMTTRCMENDSLKQKINIHKYSNYNKLWILRSQSTMTDDFKKRTYKRLCSRVRQDGIVVIGNRAEKGLEMSYNKTEVILLPYGHPFSKLYAEFIHRKGHNGVSATVSKITARFWITHLHRMVKSIVHNCVICKILNKKLSQQVMGKLPEERLKPSPAWHNTVIDLFGPFKIRDEIKKRTFGKCYGVIFNCLSTRAVHIDLVSEDSTEKFLLALRRFISLRGYPAKLYSDNGPQLVAANKEMQSVVKNRNWDELQAFGATEGLQWEFTPADAPWYNGVSESLVKSAKKATTIAIGENIMTFSELQTVFYEAANLMNERPTGRHPTSIDDGIYLSPNDLLLGRSTSRVPSGPFRESSNPRHRYEFVQNIVKEFWKKWTHDYFPSLLIQPKWHTMHRDVKVGDIVLVQDSNLTRGNWKLGKIVTVNPSKDGKVRHVDVRYKNPKPNEPVQRLIVIVPVEESNVKDTA